MKKIILIVLFILIATQSFAATCDKYWVGGGSSVNWSATAPTNWGTASNTQNNAAVPGTGENVCFDGVGTGASNSTISAAITVANLDFTGYANTVTHNTAVTLTVEGNLTFSSGMTYSGATSTSVIDFAGSGSTTIDTKNKSIRAVTFGATAGGTGTRTLSDNFTVANAITHTRGGFATAGKTVTALSYSSSNSNNRTLNFCGSTLTFSGTGTVWNASTSTNMTITACPSNPFTLAFTDASASSKTFAGGTASSLNNYQNLSITGGGSGAFIFSGTNNIYGTITIGSPKTVTFPSSTSTIFTSLGCTGTAGNVITINSSSGGTQATLEQRLGNVSCDYLNLTDSATNYVAFYAGANSTNTSNNSGWIFSAAPATPSKVTRLYNYYSN